MAKIVVSEGLRLSLEQVKRLEALGECTIYKAPAKSDEESMKRFEQADIICTGRIPIETVLYDLKDKLVLFAFVGMHWLDIDKLRENGMKVSNAPGCNKSAVTEWIIYMMITFARELHLAVNHKTEKYAGYPKETKGLSFKNVTILGKGNIGKHVGEVCELLGMNVSFFTRNDDLFDSVKDADFVVNCLATNKETKNLLGDAFFSAVKDGTYFISITDQKIYDIDALKKSLDEGKLADAAIDLEGAKAGDSSGLLYKELANYPKILVTPHIAFNTDISMRVGNDIIIENVEAWVKGKPINRVV